MECTSPDTFRRNPPSIFSPEIKTIAVAVSKENRFQRVFNFQTLNLHIRFLGVFCIRVHSFLKTHQKKKHSLFICAKKKHSFLFMKKNSSIFVSDKRTVLFWEKNSSFQKEVCTKKNSKNSSFGGFWPKRTVLFDWIRPPHQWLLGIIPLPLFFLLTIILTYLIARRRRKISRI